MIASNEALIDLLHRNCNLNIPQWKLAMRLIGWDLNALVLDGQLAGVIMRREAEIHVAIEAEYRRRFWRGELRKVLGEVIEKHGYATTTAFECSPEQSAFVRRLGFVESGREDGRIFYRLEAVPYTGRMKCHQ